MQRLDKFLSDVGVGTRTEVKAILKAGRVCVDGVSERDGGRKIDAQTQQITFDGVPVQAAGRVVVMMHKPAGFVTATQDKKEHTVMELLPEELQKRNLCPIGRLDKETEGLLLFTDDGALLHRLISPKNEVKKVYYAQHEATASQEDVYAFAQGLVLRDGTHCLPARLEPLGEGKSRVTICEGKYHQVRRMMASRSMHVLYLRREQEGPLVLGDLPVGQCRILDEEEIKQLEKVSGQDNEKGNSTK